MPKAKFEKMDANIGSKLNARQRGYLALFGEMAMRMTCGFWWSSKSGNEEAIIRGNATVCLVNTGVRHIGITCDHVYQGYLDDKNGFDSVECQFGENTFDPESRLIDRSPLGELDLATFDVPEVFVAASGRNYYHNALKWPPDSLCQTDVVLFGGYPQILRQSRFTQVDFKFQWFASTVNSVNEQRIVLEASVDRMIWAGHPEEEVRNKRLGGQSGGPVYRVIDADPKTGELLDRIELVGVIDRQVMDDLILAKPASLVRSDGTLAKPI